MFTIGEFSRISGLSIKTLRFYHEQGVLTPSHIDPENGYRYYDESKADTARAIAQLRSLEFSVAQISEMLQNLSEEDDVLEHLRSQRQVIENTLKQYGEIKTQLDTVIKIIQENRTMTTQLQFDIQEKDITPMLVAGVRMEGNYSDCGKGFSQLGKKFGMNISGKPLMLIYDSEYREGDAHFEPCMPLRKNKDVDGFKTREIPGGRCVSLVHQGPYDTIGASYAKVVQYMKDHQYEPLVPCREIYVKGPGMIFKGNPKKYITEIQMFYSFSQ